MKLKNVLLTLTVITATLFYSNRVHAQDSKILVGGGIGYASVIENMAIAAKGVYKITDEWEGALGVNYYLPKDMVYASLNWLGLDLDGHYVFLNEKEYQAYGLGGLSITRVSVSFKDNLLGNNSIATALTPKSSTSMGFNIGGGGRYQFADNLYGLAETKYTFRDKGFFQITAGVLFGL